jgi:thioredoxin-like negative regulator of GroEL
MEVETIDISSYQSFIETYPHTAIHFWADWNLIDKKMREILNELSVAYAGAIKFAAFDTLPEAHWEKCRELGLSNLPALVLYKNGKHLQTLIGLGMKEKIKVDLDRLLNIA